MNIEQQGSSSDPTGSNENRGLIEDVSSITQNVRGSTRNPRIGSAGNDQPRSNNNIDDDGALAGEGTDITVTTDPILGPDGKAHPDFVDQKAGDVDQFLDRAQKTLKNVIAPKFNMEAFYTRFTERPMEATERFQADALAYLGLINAYAGGYITFPLIFNKETKRFLDILHFARVLPPPKHVLGVSLTSAPALDETSIPTMGLPVIGAYLVGEDNIYWRHLREQRLWENTTNNVTALLNELNLVAIRIKVTRYIALSGTEIRPSMENDEDFKRSGYAGMFAAKASKRQLEEQLRAIGKPPHRYTVVNEGQPNTANPEGYDHKLYNTLRGAHSDITNVRVDGVQTVLSVPSASAYADIGSRKKFKTSSTVAGVPVYYSGANTGLPGNQGMPQVVQLANGVQMTFPNLQGKSSDADASTQLSNAEKMEYRELQSKRITQTLTPDERARFVALDAKYRSLTNVKNDATKAAAKEALDQMTGLRKDVHTGFCNYDRVANNTRAKQWARLRSDGACGIVDLAKIIATPGSKYCGSLPDMLGKYMNDDDPRFKDGSISKSPHVHLTYDGGSCLVASAYSILKNIVGDSGFKISVGLHEETRFLRSRILDFGGDREEYRGTYNSDNSAELKNNMGLCDAKKDLIWTAPTCTVTIDCSDENFAVAVQPVCVIYSQLNEMPLMVEAIQLCANKISTGPTNRADKHLFQYKWDITDHPFALAKLKSIVEQHNQTNFAFYVLPVIHVFQEVQKNNRGFEFKQQPMPALHIDICYGGRDWNLQDGKTCLDGLRSLHEFALCKLSKQKSYSQRKSIADRRSGIVPKTGFKSMNGQKRPYAVAFGN